MRELKALGTAQNRKVYGRHGVTGQMYGVSYANLDKLRKKLKTNHELAVELWATGNHDARILATKIADPDAFTSSQFDAWARDLDSYVIADAFSAAAARSAHARRKADKWTRSKREFVGQTGWNLVAYLAGTDDELTNEYFLDRIRTIEDEIHGSENRVRYSMNTALISIGTRNKTLEKKAIAAAKRIGMVHVDHGETGCKTPDAITYIPKAAAHKAAKSGKAAAKKGGAKKGGATRSGKARRK